MALKIEKLMDPIQPHAKGWFTTLGALFFFCTIVGMPIAMYLIFNRSAEKNNIILIDQIDAEAKTLLKSYIGLDPKYIDTVTANTDGLLVGSGIAYQAGIVYFMEMGVATQFPVSMLRDFHYSLEGHDTVSLVRGHLGDQMTVNEINQNAAHEAFKMSGLFLKIADIEHPEWHLMTTDKTVVTRWMEILQQAREGSI
jgi:hypothetical protein